MANEAGAGAENQDAQEASATDWKAKYEEMRQRSHGWESKAKANQAAAEELERLKAANQTEQEKALQRAQEAEAELQKLKAEAERARVVSEVAAKHGISSDVVAMLNGADADELTEQVKQLKKTLLQAPERTDDGGGNVGAKKSKADKFAESLFG